MQEIAIAAFYGAVMLCWLLFRHWRQEIREDRAAREAARKDYLESLDYDELYF